MRNEDIWRSIKTLRFLLIGLFSIFLLVTKGISAKRPVFVDVTREAGINFKHASGKSQRYFIVETLGSGVATFDYNNDGWIDIYLVNSGQVLHRNQTAKNVLYRNNGDGTFTDTTKSSGTGDLGYGIGVTIGDYDNNGTADLYVTNYGKNVLYHNNGDGTFKDVTEKAGVGHPGCGTGCAFADFDLDGDLDLYVANYVPKDQVMANTGSNGYRNPIFYDGEIDVLYQNNGDGTFIIITPQLGNSTIFRDARGLGVVAVDYNRDKFADIYIANDKSKNLYFHNNGDETFTEAATLTGVGHDVSGNALAGMGIAVGDYDNDGWIDMFVTNFAYEFNNLYHNEKEFFIDVTASAGLGNPSYLYVGWGTFFFDSDNDGDLDLFVANGHIMDNDELQSDQLTYEQPDQLFENRGDGEFIEISIESGNYFSQKYPARGAAYFDYDNDGDLDLLISNSNHFTILLRNDGGNHRNWLQITLVGTKSNRDAIGTQVTIQYDNQIQVREVQSSGSYCSVNDYRLHFGMNAAKQIDLVEVQWANGTIQQLKNIVANQHLTITENQQ